MGIAVVTGSASGIGAAVCARLAEAGDRVVGVDVQKAEVSADLGTPEGRESACAQIRAACRGGCDRLVLCAGLGNAVADHAAIASVNYFGAVELLDALLPSLRGRAGAAAVVVCSNSARFGPFDEHPYVRALLEGDEPLARELAASGNGFIAYGGSKHALSRALRRRAPQWGEAGVRLNGIAPGATETPLLRGSLEHPVWGKGVESLPIPLGRRAQPAEIANVIAYLLGPDAAYVHGAIWYVDGGNDAAMFPERF